MGKFDQISTLKHLPSLPHVLLELIRACNKPNLSLKKISSIIEQDSSLTGKVLKLINSAYYAMPRKIATIEEAVAYLGTGVVKNIAISASIFGAFSHIKGSSISLMKRFWWHSLECAILARSISKKTQFSSPDEAFLSGLLHDIGKLLLWANFKKEYQKLMENYAMRPGLLLAHEKRLVSTHAEIGAWLLERWSLNSLMVDSVRYHHDPANRIADAFPLVKIVYVSNILSARSSDIGEYGITNAQEILGLRGLQVDELLCQTRGEVEEVALSMDIEIEPPPEKVTAPSEKDRRVQEELVQEVRDTSLLLGTLQNLLEAQDEEMILGALRQGLDVVLGVRDVFFFCCDNERGHLRAKSMENDEETSMITDLAISMDAQESLLVASLREGKTKDSFTCLDGVPPILLDEQIIHFIGREGILCIPMVANRVGVGVIVLGLDEEEFCHLSEHLGLLTMFAGQAATALHLENLRQSQQKTIETERLEAMTTVARKLVHEVNNPLSIMKNYLAVLEMKLAQRNVAQEEIQILNEEIDRVLLTLRKVLPVS